MTFLSERKVRWLLGGGGASCFALLLALEIVTEEDAIAPFDLLVDAATILLTVATAVGATLLAQRLHAQHDEKMALIRDLEIARAEGENWRAKAQTHLNGLREEMEKQFQTWGMTSAEREIGLLILKGLSHKEVANLRTTSEATVRQQAQSIYRKADLPGKTAFTAYFLEDLVEPAVEGRELATS